MKYRIYLPGLASLLSVLSLLFVVSCSKEKSSGETNQQEEQVSMVSTESEAEAEMVYNGVFDDVMGVNDDVGMAGTGIFGRSAIAVEPGSPEMARPLACFTVSVTHPANTLFPARVVIDFGATPCMGPDGHTRRGKIVIEYTNRLIIPGAIAATSFQDFYFDSIKVEGTHKITNTSSPLGTLPLSRQFKAEVINGKLTHPNGNFVEWNSTKTVTQIEGLITPDRPLDDIFKIEGASRGRAKRGNLLVAWESNVVEPLIKKFTCRWIVKGIVRTLRVNATANSPWVSSLNFGNGTCDNQAVVTINGVSRQITLR